MAERAVVLCGAVLLLAGSFGCLSRREEPSGRGGAECSSCHGDPQRAGDALRRSAPPRDLSGAATPEYPGVGAHSVHLDASATHGSIPCRECHVVPEEVDSPGHADDAAPAEVVFGALARAGNHSPSYEAVSRRCVDSYCHGSAVAVWTEPRDSKAACGTCHGLPPAAPHPQNDRCWTCHGEVIDAQRRFSAPERHVDGAVQLRADSCTQCHGRGDDPAPPADTSGRDAVSEIGVGAHAAHLSGGRSSRPLACAECHAVPEAPSDYDHADGLPAEVSLRGVARAEGRDDARWERSEATCTGTWCHGPEPGSRGRSPKWTEAAGFDCQSCHGAPPAPPHPQMQDCSRCHGAVVNEDDVTMRARARHVDGEVDVAVPEGCTTCHGGENAAPPRDTTGATSPSAGGVGAHQTHVRGTARSRAVPCSECHRVPESVLAVGHIDTALPAEVAFSGVARAFDAAPQYREGTCQGTPCHGAAFPGRHDSGGSLRAPSWTRVDGSQAACGTCHGLPPPRPHPYYAEDCGRCHENVSLDGTTILRPDLHVDGIVTFTLDD